MTLKVRNLLRACFVLIALYLAYGLLMGLLYTIFPNLNTTQYNQDFVTELLTESPLKAFIMIVVIAPIIEESMFRTLLKPSHLEVVLFFMIWPVFFLLRLFPIEVHWAVLLLFTAVFLFCVVYLMKQLIPLQRTRRIRYFLHRWKIQVWVITSFLFGFMHIGNYVDEFLINLPLFLIILPRILAGIMVGWIKIQNDALAWPIILHAINNGTAFILIYMSL